LCSDPHIGSQLLGQYEPIEMLGVEQINVVDLRCGTINPIIRIIIISESIAIYITKIILLFIIYKV